VFPRILHNHWVGATVFAGIAIALYLAKHPHA
jgi:hypothetical protein